MTFLKPRRQIALGILIVALSVAARIAVSDLVLVDIRCAGVQVHLELTK